MGASFRNIGEITELAGCDLLTISPELLDELQEDGGNPDPQALRRDGAAQKLEKIHLDEKTFRWMLNEDAMATEKLADGIRRFNADLSQAQRIHRQVLAPARDRLTARKCDV